MDGDKETAHENEIKLQIRAVEIKITELKSRWPYHSVQPRMVVELEDLEEERERLRRSLAQQ